MGELIKFPDPERDLKIDEGFRRVARIALFNELADMHLDGMCTFDEAIAQYKHDLAEMDNPGPEAA